MGRHRAKLLVPLLLLVVAVWAAVIVSGPGAEPAALRDDGSANASARGAAASGAAPPPAAAATAEPGVRENASAERRVRVLSADQQVLPGVSFAVADRSVRRLPAAAVVARTNEHGVAVLQRSWLEQAGEIAFGRDGWVTRTLPAATVLASDDTLELQMDGGAQLDVRVATGERTGLAEEVTVVVSLAPGGLGAAAWDPLPGGLPGLDPANAIHVVTTRRFAVLPALPPGAWVAAVACPVAVPTADARAAMRRVDVPGALVVELQAVAALVVELIDDALLHRRAESSHIDTRDPLLAPIRARLAAAHQDCYVEVGVEDGGRATAALQLMTVRGRSYEGRHSFRALGPGFRAQRVHATGPALPMGEIDLRVAREFENVEWPHDDLTFVATQHDEAARRSFVVSLSRGRTRVPEGAYRVLCEGPWRFPVYETSVFRDAVTRLDFTLPSQAIRLVFTAKDPNSDEIHRGDLLITQGDYVVSWRDTFRDGPRSVYLREGRARLHIATKDAFYDDDAFFTREMEATGYEVLLQWRQ
jgi:hypothetical protein